LCAKQSWRQRGLLPDHAVFARSVLAAAFPGYWFTSISAHCAAFHPHRAAKPGLDDTRTPGLGLARPAGLANSSLHPHSYL